MDEYTISHKWKNHSMAELQLLYDWAMTVEGEFGSLGTQSDKILCDEIGVEIEHREREAGEPE
jgi:hypothetical protein